MVVGLCRGGDWAVLVLSIGTTVGRETFSLHSGRRPEYACADDS